VPSIVIAHDMRPSSPDLSAAFADGAAGRGSRRDPWPGLGSTDMAYFAAGSLNMPGAMFTASHNPAKYNGIKMCRAGALPVGLETGLGDIRDLAQAILDGTDAARADARGTVSDRDLLRPYAEYICADSVDLFRHPAPRGRCRRRQRHGRIYGARPVLGDEKLRALPLDITPLYFELDGTFPNHEANPLEPANIVDLQAAVVDTVLTSVSPSTATRIAASSSTSSANRCHRARSPPRLSRPASWPNIPAPRSVHNLITSSAVPEIVTERTAAQPRTHPGRALVHQGRDGTYGCGVRR